MHTLPPSGVYFNASEYNDGQRSIFRGKQSGFFRKGEGIEEASAGGNISESIAGCTGSFLQICAYDANIAFKISAILFVWKSV